jgi:mono/diheme cytochrome c family protein
MVLLGVVLAGVTVERSLAQAKPGSTAKAPAKTTLSGVYTASQAAKGEEMYYNLCIACHPKGTYAGPSFKTNWNGRPLSDLWDWISNKMPKNDPGSLTPDEVAQVMSYILQQNKMPAGQVALPTNERTLYGIRIQIK